MRDRSGTSLHPPIEDATFDERRLQLLVNFSASLRWRMFSITGVIAAVIWGGGAPWPWVVVWLVATLAIRELRALMLLRLRAATQRPIAERLCAATLATLSLGAAYGSAALFMLRLDTAYDAMLSMLLMTLSAGAVSTTFTIVPAFIAFAAAISLPTAVMWIVAAGGGGLAWAVAALIPMIFQVQVKFARENMALFKESFSIRLENQALLQQLSAERAQLAQARDAAVQADVSKSRFLASASHDLRQPLQSLLLNSGALSRMRIDGEARAIATEMSEGIEALRQMLDALLDISKLDAGAVAANLQPVALDQLLHWVCARFRPAAQARGLHLDHACSADLLVVSDAELLRRIVANLVDNAIKFTTVGRIDLRAQRDADRVLLTVTDTGSGIAAGDRDRVFEDLTQLNNPQRNRAGGHGLGLGIVRRLARVLDIEVEIESQPGRGTQFRLRLPLASPTAVVTSPSATAPPGLVARNLLVLDDDADVRTSYARALASLGCRAVCTGTVDEALNALAEHDPEAAIVDYRLADDCDGLQAIERLRAARPGLAAVIVSADVSTLWHEDAARAGVAVLRKPVTDAALAAAINDAVGERAAALHAASIN